MQYLESFRKCLLLFSIALLLACGGGGSGGGVASGGDQGSSPPPSSGTTTVQLQSELARSVPSNVTHLRLTGYDLDGQVLYGPRTEAKAPLIDFLLVPVNVRRIQVEYLQSDRVVGLGLRDVTLVVGQVAVVSGLDFRNVDAVLESLRIEPAALTLAAGTTGKLDAVGIYEDGTVLDVSQSVRWSSPSALIDLTADGSVTALGIGSAIVTAELGGKSASATVTVSQATVSSLRLEPPSATVAAGTGRRFAVLATFSDRSEQDVTDQANFSVDQPEVASVVLPTGSVLGNAPGETSITASFGGKSAEAQLTVTNATLARIEVTPANRRFPKGTAVSFTAMGILSDGGRQDLTDDAIWSSLNPSIIDVTGAGIARGLAVGSTSVRARYQGLTGQTTATVTSAVVTRLAVEPETLVLPEGQTLVITAIATYSDQSSRQVNNDALFSSSRPEVASVQTLTNHGLVTALTAGDTLIKVEFAGFSAESSVTVPITPRGNLQVDLNLVQPRSVDRVISRYRLSLLAEPLPGGAVLQGPREYDRSPSAAQQSLAWNAIPAADYVLLMEFFDSTGLRRGIFRQLVTITADQTTIISDPAWNDESLTPPEPQVPQDPTEISRLVTGTVRGLVYDSSRSRLYLTSSGSNAVRIYDPATRTIIGNISVGSNPWGIDITADNSTLVVGLSGTNQVAIVNLSADPPTVIRADVPEPSDGTNRPRNVAVAANDKAFFGCVVDGDGWSDLWELDILNQVITRRVDFVRDPLLLASSADKETLLFAEGDISSGPWFLYNSSTNAFERQREIGQLHNQAAINSDGSQVNFAAGFYNRARQRVADGYGASTWFCYSPVGATGFAGGTDLRIVDTASHTVHESLELPFAITGPMVASGDGRRIFAVSGPGLLDVDLGPNRPPMLLPLSELSVPVGSSASVLIEARDADNDDLIISALQLPNGAEFDEDTGRLAYQPTGVTSGPVEAVLSVGDGTTQASRAYTLRAVATGSAVSFVPIDGELSNLAFDPSTDVVFATNSTHNRVDRWRLAELRQETPLPVGSSPQGLDVNPAGTRLVVCANGSEFLQWVDLDTLATTSVFSVRDDGHDTSRPFEIAFAASGRVLYTSEDPGATLVDIRELDMAAGITTRRPDLINLATRQLDPSGDRQKIGFVDLNGGVHTYDSMTELRQTLVRLALLITDLTLNQTGSRVAVLPGPLLLDGSGTTVATGTGYTRFAFVSGSLGAGHKGTNAIDLLSLDSLSVVESVALPLPAVGPIEVTPDGETLLVVCDGGIAVIDL